MKLLLLFLLTFSYAFAVPALNIQRTFTQADGSTFKAKAVGNQHLNWIETTDGEVLKYNTQKKNFEYATLKSSSLKASGVPFVKNGSIRARSIGRVNKIDKKELYQLWAKKRKEAHERRVFH